MSYNVITNNFTEILTMKRNKYFYKMMKNLLKQNMDTQHIIGAMTTVELKNWKKGTKWL